MKSALLISSLNRDPDALNPGRRSAVVLDDDAADDFFFTIHLHVDGEVKEFRISATSAESLIFALDHHLQDLPEWWLRSSEVSLVPPPSFES